MSTEDEVKGAQEQLKVIVDNLAQAETLEVDPRVKQQIIDNLKHQEKLLREMIDEMKAAGEE